MFNVEIENIAIEMGKKVAMIARNQPIFKGW
jgi:phage anti-repressor protein